MARVACTHNIAWADLEAMPSNQVSVTLGGDVRGSAVLPYEPSIIQSWIRQHCGLSCFRFSAPFRELASDMQALETSTKGSIVASQSRLTWDKAEIQATAERKLWAPTVHKDSCACAQTWAPSRYTETEAENTATVATSYAYKEEW